MRKVLDSLACECQECDDQQHSAEYLQASRHPERLRRQVGGRSGRQFLLATTKLAISRMTPNKKAVRNTTSFKLSAVLNICQSRRYRRFLIVQSEGTAKTEAAENPGRQHS